MHMRRHAHARMLQALCVRLQAQVRVHACANTRSGKGGYRAREKHGERKRASQQQLWFDSDSVLGKHKPGEICALDELVEPTAVRGAAMMMIHPPRERL